MSRISAALSALALFGALASNPAEAAQRVFVASYGSDANTATFCGFTNPCRGFTAAMTVVDPGGEVVALDAAGYGAVTITKSVTLTANPGFYAGISASTGNAVTIATASVKVILRGLNINGVGATNGVNMTNGASLTVNNCVISNFANEGVRVVTAAKVSVTDSIFSGNSTGIFVDNGATLDVARSRAERNSFVGFWVNSATAALTTTGSFSDSTSTGALYGFVNQTQDATAVGRLAVTRSSSTGNGDTGIYSSGLGTNETVVSSSMVTGNAIGLYRGVGTFETLGNNTVRQNGSNTGGAITVVPGI